jgi:hypothetical protein
MQVIFPDKDPMPSLETEGQLAHFRRMRAIEEILLTEYEARLVEFSSMQSDLSTPGQIEFAGERYLRAIRKLRKFLADGEIPTDLADRGGREGR